MTNYREGDRVRTPDEERFAPEWRGVDATVADRGGMEGMDTMVRVRHPDGYCSLFKAEDLTPVRPANADYRADYPIGIMVRDTHGGAIGEVVDHRFESNAPVVQFTVGRAPFPDPVGRLERVHVLTHDELHALDDAIDLTPSSEKANVIIGKYLRPTVKHRFVVEIEAEVGSPFQPDTRRVHEWLTTNHTTGYPVTVTEASE